MPDPDPRIAQLAALEHEHAELVASLPRHSIPAVHLLRIEELAEEIAALRAALEIEAAQDDDPA